MSEIVDKGKEVGEKAKALADAGVEKLKGGDWKAQGDKAKALADEGIEKLKKVDWKAQGNAAAEKAKAAKAKIQATWKSGTKGKIVCVIGAALVLWVGSCIFGGSGNTNSVRDEDCRIDYKSNLTSAASQGFQPEEGVGYVSLGGFTIHQYIPNEGAVLAMLSNNGLGNLVAMMSGNAQGISEGSDVGNIIYVKTPRKYTDGQALAGGVYIYEGIVTFETTDGGSKSVKSFREMDEAIASRRIEEDKKKRLEEEERNAKPIEGYTIPLPKKTIVKSLCGLEFGKPPAEIEKVLGKRVEGRPISENNNSAVFELKKKFRLCDRAKVSYYGEPPFMVLSEVELIGKVDKDKISAISCREEVEKVSKLLCEHFGIEYEEGMGGNNDGECYHYIHLPKMSGRIDVKYDARTGLFTVKHHCSALRENYWYDEVMQSIQKKVKEQGESKKTKLSFDNDAGSDML